jgi:hypothetical protein
MYRKIKLLNKVLGRSKKEGEMRICGGHVRKVDISCAETAHEVRKLRMKNSGGAGF